MANDLRELYKQQTGHEFGTEPEKEKLEPITYTTQQMAEMLQVSEATVRRIIKSENIPTIPCTKNIIVMKEAFDAWRKTKEFTA